MTREELIEKLKRFRTNDPEDDHANADEALRDFIGDPEVREAFEAVEKWYA